MAECYSKKSEFTNGIDANYYSGLYMPGFIGMMDNPSYCYKFYWLEALVQLIDERRKEVTFEEVIDYMIVNAWIPVLEYHLHLSTVYEGNKIKDNLERAIINLQKASGLTSKAKRDQIQQAIVGFSKEISEEKCKLTEMVPHKALSKFANVKGEGIDLNSTQNRMIAYYNRLNSEHIVLPYTFSDEAKLKKKVIINDSWAEMIRDNITPILGWIQSEKAKWLQKINPEVPGIIYKLSFSDDDKRKLQQVHKLWDAIMETEQIRDIYSNDVINGSKYDVDHFIPRSFVMNDEIWNLTPMIPELNNLKSNHLPDWEKKFGDFARIQFLMYSKIHDESSSRIHDLFVKCYKDNLHSIWAATELYRKGNPESVFYTILRKNMEPVYDSARRQGYDVWKRRRLIQLL